MDVMQKAKELYDAKIRTGKYDHYSPEMLELLFADCVTQTATMHRINSHRKN